MGRRQRLHAGAPLESPPGGWMRSLGAVDPYLALHARCGTGRGEVDAAWPTDASA